MDPEKEPKTTVDVSVRRGSRMSVEDPLSPASDDSDSISIASRPSTSTRHSKEHPAHTLSRHLSHTSSVNAVGGIVPTISRTWTQGTAGTTDTRDMSYEIDFDDGDKTNPQNWSLAYKSFIIAVFSFSTTCTVLYSTSYTSAIPGMLEEFDIHNESIGILGVTTYLLGMAAGSIILAPLSEMYGRRPIYLIVMALFVVFVIPCAVAQNMATILVVRFLAAFCAAAMISNAPGTVNDIVDEDHRALAFSVWSIGPMNGPVIGPVVGGFVFQYLGWRWTNWVVVIVSGIAWVLVALVPETYAPAILRDRAKKQRKSTDCEKWWSRYDDSLEFFSLLKLNLKRPFVLTVTEPIW